ncbi:TetR/AcrR family transcriptional regulator [Streptomyces sp. B1866]|uniref:TetR/AcrR family transcriptional regulator n=1 Tax=Streptomyces sp. B1866 TaxID=3075431 RepID=UPI00288EDC52|nr:TetR/AcrR family transcriptional regulator [Streptomyces sp. B1866]MDT3400255.1 TetR/AcrR family transcriptional regulator [Streptomyces sp. B1866]
MRDEKQARCRVCQAGLPPAARGRPRAYCSRGCQAKAYRRRQRQARPGRTGDAAHPAGPPAPDGPGPCREPETAGREPERTGPEPVGTGGRTRQIAAAVWRIAADRGLESASMREVAAEAGVSLRVVQYAFGTKHRLLVEALRLLHEDSERHARARLARLPDPDDPRAVLRAVLAEFLPLDEARRTSLRVLVAYYVRSLTDPALRAVFLHGGQPLEKLVAALIRQCADAGAAAPGLDPEREADLLVSGVTGLGLDVLHGTRTVDDVLRTVDYHLARVLGRGPADGDGAP